MCSVLLIKWTDDLHYCIWTQTLLFLRLKFHLLLAWSSELESDCQPPVSGGGSCDEPPPPTLTHTSADRALPPVAPAAWLELLGAPHKEITMECCRHNLEGMLKAYVLFLLCSTVFFLSFRLKLIFVLLPYLTCVLLLWLEGLVHARKATLKIQIHSWP